MRQITSIVVLLIMLCMTLPALACAQSPRMSKMERDCCQQMHGKCGGEMAKQGCCQPEVRTDLRPLPAPIVTAPILPVMVVAILYQRLLDAPEVDHQRRQPPEEYPPPGLLVAATTVLQI